MDKNTAVIVVDMLYDFIYGALKCERAEKLIWPIQRLINEARNSGCPVIFTNDAHTKEDKELLIWGEHAMKGTPGAKVIDELKPLENELIVEKHTYSCFLNTNLDKYLKDHNITTLYIVGIQAHICVQHACYDAYTLGYNIKVPCNCTDAFTEDLFNHAIEYMKSMYGVDINSY